MKPCYVSIETVIPAAMKEASGYPLSELSRHVLGSAVRWLYTVYVSSCQWQYHEKKLVWIHVPTPCFSLHFTALQWTTITSFSSLWKGVKKNCLKITLAMLKAFCKFHWLLSIVFTRLSNDQTHAIEEIWNGKKKFLLNELSYLAFSPKSLCNSL